MILLKLQTTVIYSSYPPPTTLWPFFFLGKNYVSKWCFVFSGEINLAVL
jgi:hypothetical protein